MLTFLIESLFTQKHVGLLEWMAAARPRKMVPLRLWRRVLCQDDQSQPPKHIRSGSRETEPLSLVGCFVLITIREAGRAPGSANGRFGFLTQERKYGSSTPHQPVSLTCLRGEEGNCPGAIIPTRPQPRGQGAGHGRATEEQPETAGQRPGSEPHFPFLPQEPPGRPGNRVMTVT